MEVLTRKITAQEFRLVEFDDLDQHWYELINGEIMRQNYPAFKHQNCQRHLFRILDNHVIKKDLGNTIIPPFGLILGEINNVQPDIMFISKANSSIIKENGVWGAPELVVEIISPHSMRRDRYDKMKLYHDFKIQEYWLVDPNNQTVEVYNYTEKEYELTCFAVEEGEVSSKMIEGFIIDVKNIFPKKAKSK